MKDKIRKFAVRLLAEPQASVPGYVARCAEFGLSEWRLRHEREPRPTPEREHYQLRA